MLNYKTRIVNIMYKQKKRFIIVICNIIFMILLFIVGVTDATSDDFGMQVAMLSGSSYYSAFNTIFWSFPIFILQKIIPFLAWEYVAQVIVIIISLNIFIIYFFKKFSFKTGFVLSLFFTVLIFQNYIQQFNFTKTSALGVGAGILYIFFTDNDKFKKKNILLGSILIIVSVQIRTDVIFIMIGAVGLLVIDFFILQRKSMKKGIIVCVFLIILSTLFAWTDFQIKEKDPSYGTYFRMKNKLANLVDYKFANYEDALPAYKELGMSKNDVEMISRKCESDPSFYSEELLDNLIKKVSYKWSFVYFKDNLITLFYKAVSLLLGQNFYYFLYGIIIVGVFRLQGKGKLSVAGSLLMIFVYILLFAFMGRMVERVVISVVLLSIIHIFVIMDCDDKSSSKRNNDEISNYIFIFMILLSFIVSGSIYQRRNMNVDWNAYKLAKNITEDEKHFYAYTVGLDQEYKVISNLLLTNSYFSDLNSIYLNVTPMDPYENMKLSSYGISNIYNDSINSDVIRFVLGNDVDTVQNYVKEHYCPNAEFVLDDCIEGYSIYKVVDKK